uniref:Period circadian protein homolog 2 n=1 Tax=Electrophorus electricus TaxID=8005 RepID=A0A4W4FIY5_ELEEL
VSEEPQSYPYRGGSEEDDTELHCGSVSHLHHMGRASDGSDSSHDPPPFPGSQPPLHEDMEMGGNGSSGSGTESHGNESHGNESHGNESVGSSNGNGKDSALLESSGSNKSHNSQSLSPPSSSNAFSLVSSEQDHPSTSGCSSELSAKAKTQKELFKTLKELKLRLPAEKRRGGRASTLHTLRYALRCVKQVKANEEYYQMLMINDSQPPGLDMSSYTIKEINSITSEYTLKNADIFAVAVSLITGKIVYISEQASGILHCRKDEFKDRKFVEFLTPQDVSVFYSFTTPYRLPAWSMCTGAESSATEFMQEKSFFCRISGGKEKEGELQYYPFRMTPYLMKVQDSALSEEHFCCLILAERVHSGYEAPRIPPDKRIFTTTHTPNCVFQDVDERAVPLLGYLPQDLIGTPVLLHLHPSDRPLMLAVHRKILQYMGQPFDHSSIRFCTRNGEYVTIDTSWSSFVNPWSRKVSFVIGRHKVRMGPVNEDVFSAPAFTEGKIMDSDIQEITEQIHKLLLQPVHSMGSSGYGSHGSNGSHDHLLSMTSSSDSNSNGNIVIGNDNGPQEGTKAKPVNLSPGGRQKDAALVVRDGPAASEELRNQTMYSYQQINCMDSVIRYLESCNIPITVKRKYQFSSNTTSSNSDEEKKGCDGVQPTQDPLSMKSSKKPQSAAVVGGALAPLALPTKAESVVSITSQCSYSSTIVHVGDKKPQPESEIIEDVAESPAPLATVSIMSPPTLEQGAYRKLGLTKQVLAAHTQKEEQAFLTRCRELCLSRLLLKAAHHSASTARNRRQSTDGGEANTHRLVGRTRKSKKLRMKKPDSSDSAVSQRRFRPPLQGLNQTSWSPSEASQSAFSLPYPTMVPGYPLYTTAPPPASTLPPGGDRNNTSSRFEETPSAQATPTAPPYSTPLVTPVVAFVLPNYMFPQLSTPPRPPCYTEPQQVYSTSQPFQHQQTVNTQQPPQPQQNYSTQPPFQTQQMPFPYRMTSDSKYVISEPNEVPSPSPALSPPLFGSHCSSPLQLDLLQLEDKPDSHSTAPPSGSQGNCSSAQEKSTAVSNSSTIAVGDVQQVRESYLLIWNCYFGSVDSSENNHKEKRREDGQNLKYAVQEPLWLLMANTDDKVMMTYQVPSRNVDKVLRDDRERLRRMQKSQPRFTSDQRRELVEQHPWMRRGGLPKALNIKECLYCENDACAPVEEDLPDMELSILRGETAQEDGVSPSPANEQQPGSDSVS